MIGSTTDRRGSYTPNVLNCKPPAPREVAASPLGVPLDSLVGQGTAS
jgi:hypothetical protein